MVRTRVLALVITAIVAGCTPAPGPSFSPSPSNVETAVSIAGADVCFTADLEPDGGSDRLAVGGQDGLPETGVEVRLADGRPGPGGRKPGVRRCG
jgi:hypothetical protein